MFTVLDDLSTKRSHDILEEVSKVPGTRIGDLYASFMDEAAAEKKGITPILPLLTAIRGLPTKAALAKQMADLRVVGLDSGFGLGVGQDDKDPDTEIVGMYQGGLGLPDRDYYLKSDAEIVKARTAYVAYLAKLFQLAGEPNGPARAQAILAFETKLATVHWTRVDSRDATKTYNKWARADFATKAPGFDWSAFLGEAGMGARQSYLVAQAECCHRHGRADRRDPAAGAEGLAGGEGDRRVRALSVEAVRRCRVRVQQHHAFRHARESATLEARREPGQGFDRRGSRPDLTSSVTSRPRRRRPPTSW